MTRCLIFIASLFVAFVAISSTATASPSEWRRTAFTADEAPSEGPGTMASWATVPAPRLFTFVTIQL